MKTLVLIKPGAVHRELVGKIITRFEEKGLTIIALRVIIPDRELVTVHYTEHKDEDFFGPLVDTLVGKPVVAMVLEGPEAVYVVRTMIGNKVNCRHCLPGTIRGDFGLSGRNTVVHGSDSVESANREIPLWFASQNIYPYRKSTFEWTRTEIDPQD